MLIFTITALGNSPHQIPLPELETVYAIVLATSSVDLANDIFRNITFD